jgi:hypothetical protein
MRPLWDFDSVVEALGGTAKVARLTGNASSAVCVWRRHKGLFPAKYYFRMKGPLADRGYYAPISLFTFDGEHAAFRNSA